MACFRAFAPVRRPTSMFMVSHFGKICRLEDLRVPSRITCAPHVFDVGPDVASLERLSARRLCWTFAVATGPCYKRCWIAIRICEVRSWSFPRPLPWPGPGSHESGLGTRVSVYAGDVFANAPRAHDVCLLCWVLHDWSDDRALRILETCVAATTSRGRIIVIERPRNDSQDVLESDLRMLVFFGGRERSRREWLTLFAEAGLTAIREAPVGTGGFVAYCLERTDTRVVEQSIGGSPLSLAS